MKPRREQVLEFVRAHPEGVNDGEIAEAIGTIRPAVQHIAAQLAEEGSIVRASARRAGERRRVYNYPVSKALAQLRNTSLKKFEVVITVEIREV